MSSVIEALYQTLVARKNNPSPNSYTAKLLADGEDAIVQKIGEEAVEVIIAAKGQGEQRVIEETADLLYHTLVLLVSQDIPWHAVEAELESRHR